MKRYFLALMAFGLSACGGSSDNNAPVAYFTSNCTQFVCEFDASISTATEGRIASYSWNFGDGSRGAGKQVTHPYTIDGPVPVQLTVTATNGQTGIAARSVSVTGSPFATYYGAMHDSVSLAILADELAHGLFITLDDLEDAVEAQGSPNGTPYGLTCTSAGTAEIAGWTDSDNNMEINGSETLAFTASNCAFTSTAPEISTTDTARVTGDVDASTFSLEGNDEAQTGIRIGRYPEWSLTGPLAYSIDRSGASPVISYSTTAASLVLAENSGMADAVIDVSLDVTSSAPLSEISGSASFKLNTSVFNVTYIDPVTISRNGDGSTTIDSGRLSIKRGQDTVYLEPGADPAYVLASLDKGSDGSVDNSSQIRQSILVDPLDD